MLTPLLPEKAHGNVVGLREDALTESDLDGRGSLIDGVIAER